MLETLHNDECRIEVSIPTIYLHLLCLSLLLIVICYLGLQITASLINSN